MKEHPSEDQIELFPIGEQTPEEKLRLFKKQREEIQAKLIRKKKKESEVKQIEAFPEVVEDERRLKAFKPGPARDAIRGWLVKEKRILKERNRKKKNI